MQLSPELQDAIHKHKLLRKAREEASERYWREREAACGPSDATRAALAHYNRLHVEFMKLEEEIVGRFKAELYGMRWVAPIVFPRQS